MRLTIGSRHIPATGLCSGLDLPRHRVIGEADLGRLVKAVHDEVHATEGLDFESLMSFVEEIWGVKGRKRNGMRRRIGW